MPSSNTSNMTKPVTMHEHISIKRVSRRYKSESAKEAEQNRLSAAFHKEPRLNAAGKVICHVPIVECLCPGERVNSENAAEAVKLDCTFDQCEYAKHKIHMECYLALEDELYTILKRLGHKTRNWTDSQIRQNIWRKRGTRLPVACLCRKGCVTRNEDAWAETEKAAIIRGPRTPKTSICVSRARCQSETVSTTPRKRTISTGVRKSESNTDDSGRGTSLLSSSSGSHSPEYTSPVASRATIVGILCLLICVCGYGAGGTDPEKEQVLDVALWASTCQYIGTSGFSWPDAFKELAFLDVDVRFQHEIVCSFPTPKIKRVVSSLVPVFRDCSSMTGGDAIFDPKADKFSFKFANTCPLLTAERSKDSIRLITASLDLYSQFVIKKEKGEISAAFLAAINDFVLNFLFA